MRKVSAIVTILVGLALCVGSLLGQGPARARAGQEMLDGARDAATVAGSARLAGDAELVIGGVTEAIDGELPALRDALGLSEAAFDEVLRSRYPAVAAVTAVSTQANDGLTKTVANLQRRATDFESADALPVPGVSLTAAAILVIVLGLVLVGLGAAQLRSGARSIPVAVAALCLLAVVGTLVTRSPQKAAAAERILGSLNITQAAATATVQQFDGASAFIDEYENKLVPDVARALGTGTASLTARLDVRYPAAAQLRTDRLAPALANIGADVRFRQENVDNFAKVGDFPLQATIWTTTALQLVAGLVALLAVRRTGAVARAAGTADRGGVVLSA